MQFSRNLLTSQKFKNIFDAQTTDRQDRDTIICKDQGYPLRKSVRALLPPV
jgi:hypothetical protein